MNWEFSSFGKWFNNVVKILTETIAIIQANVVTLENNIGSTISSQWISTGSDISFQIGNVGIGNSATLAKLFVDGSLHVDGSLVTSGQITAFDSATIWDRRLKKDFIVLENNLDFISKLNPLKFTWKKNNIHDVGFIAQEIEELCPILVSEFESLDDKKLYKSLKYEKIIPFIVGGIKELHDFNLKFRQNDNNYKKILHDIINFLEYNNDKQINEIDIINNKLIEIEKNNEYLLNTIDILKNNIDILVKNNSKI